MKNSVLKSIFLVLGLILVGNLAGCQTPPPAVSFPQITFSHMTPLTLSAAIVEVQNRYSSPMADPNVEHRMPVSPEKALRRWSADRLKAGGQPGTVRVIIGDASVKGEALTRTPGIKGIFTTEQAARYTASIEASVELLDERGGRRAVAQSRVRRSVTTPENASLNDRDKIWFKLLEDLMKDFNAEMERNIRQYMGGYLL
jgi:hypothetical protein